MIAADFTVPPNLYLNCAMSDKRGIVLRYMWI